MTKHFNALFYYMEEKIDRAFVECPKFEFFIG